MQRVFALLAWALAILAVLVVATSIGGGVHFYSPVPLWDQWRGQIAFYQRFDEQPLVALWAQHNEHRIVLSRLLFLLDRAAFDSGNAFLIVVNYLLAAGTAAVFACEYLRNGDRRLPPMLVIALIVGMLMLWTQQESLLWGFQSGSLGVNLFAVWAFALLARGHLTASLLLACAALLTLGNGIVAFGGLALIAVLQGMGWRRLAIIVVAGGVAAIAYFYGYQTPPPGADPNAVDIALAQPKFFLIVLGGPLYPVTHELASTMVLGVMSLLVFMAGALYVIVKRKVTPYRAFLIATYCFVAVSALGATHSRWMYGLISATSSRYTTPALVGLVATMLLLIDVTSVRMARSVSVLSAALFIALAGYQRAALASNAPLYFRKFAIVCQKVGMGLAEQEALISPRHLHDVFVDSTSYANSHALGVYRSEWMRVAGQQVDSAHLVGACHGQLDTVKASPSGLTVVSGWLSRDAASDPSSVKRSIGDRAIAITDSRGRTVGWGVSGLDRPDLRKKMPGAAPSGWMAVAEASDGPLSAFVYSDGSWCKLQGEPNP